MGSMGSLWWIPPLPGVSLGPHLRSMGFGLPKHPGCSHLDDKKLVARWPPRCCLGEGEISLSLRDHGLVVEPVRRTPKRLPITLGTVQAYLGAGLGEPKIPGYGRCQEGPAKGAGLLDSALLLHGHLPGGQISFLSCCWSSCLLTKVVVFFFLLSKL